jgi:rhodanese-related sulfurtransferase
MVLKKNLRSMLRQGGAILALAFILSLSANHLRKDGLPLVGDWSPRGRLGAIDTVEDPVVTIEEAQALFFTHGAVFIDARPPEAFIEGHIEGAVNIYPENFDASFERAMAEVAPDSLIITYCDGETCTLSKELALQLTGKGYTHVRVLVNGWSVWQDSGLPVEAGRR